MHTVVLTGFKPFGPHLINDSETCVGIIKQSGLEEELNIHLVTQVLEVAYDSALACVKELWAKYNPFLVVHLGVHNDNYIRIERCARKCGYNKEDVYGNLPPHDSCPLGLEEIITTSLDISDVCSCANGSYYVDYSENAGSYLCEYVYYTSLCHDPSRAVFIHVPPYDCNVPPQEKAIIIKEIIKKLYVQRLQQID